MPYCQKKKFFHASRYVRLSMTQSPRIEVTTSFGALLIHEWFSKSTGTNAGVKTKKRANQLDLIILILCDQGSHKIHANLQRKVSGKDPSCMSEDFTHVSDWIKSANYLIVTHLCVTILSKFYSCIVNKNNLVLLFTSSNIPPKRVYMIKGHKANINCHVIVTLRAIRWLLLPQDS
jgi:hypothetical protein